jgi:hypothetical protein
MRFDFLTRDKAEDQAAGRVLGLVAGLLGAYGFISSYAHGVEAGKNYIAGSIGLLSATALLGSEHTYDSMQRSYKFSSALLAFPATPVLHLFAPEMVAKIGDNTLNFFIGAVENAIASQLSTVFTNKIHDYIYPEVDPTGLHHSYGID